MKISVVTPVLNEIKFIKGWYENVKKFSDEQIVVDTGSTDGTFEYLQSVSRLDRTLSVWRWPEVYKPYEWPEHEIRNWLLKQASGDWICMLDADDLVGEDFIENLNCLGSAKWLIGRFVYLQFWMSYKYLRKRSLWPPLRTLIGRDGRKKIGLLKNWRGWYPNKVPKICKKDVRIGYSPTGNHCVLQYRGLNRLSYHLPWVTKDFDIGIFHSHFVNFDKQGKEKWNREYERVKIQEVPLLKYQGELPREIKYYKF